LQYCAQEFDIDRVKEKPYKM